MVAAMDKPSFAAGNFRLLLFGFTLALLGAIVAWHHPFGDWFGVAIFAALVCVSAYAYALWPLVLVGLMPVLGFAPWTGWVTFEEFDLLILAIASGACLRTVFWGAQDAQDSYRGNSGRTVRIWILTLYGLCLAVSMLRGFQDAGGFEFGWYQGYFGPMNSVRLAKSFFLAALLLPLWLSVERNHPERSVALLAWGCASGLGLASLAAVWERVAFTGLLNFSSDYRTTALFWETHVGGAALDGYLAISLPLALYCYLKSPDLRTKLVSGAMLVLAGYACLTTFSRGVYLAVPIGLAIFLVLNFRQKKPSERRTSGLASGALWTAGGISVFSAMAYWVFPTSGYRGMLAVLIALYLMVAMFPIVSSSRRAGWWPVLLGLVGAMGLGLLSISFPKGAYGVFGLGVIMVALGLRWAVLQHWKLAVSVAGYWLAVFGCGLIAYHWGGASALQMMLPVCGVLVLGLLSGFFVRLPVQEGERHLGFLGGMAISGLLVATFFGGQYMTDRFATTERDLEHRLAHWSGGLGLMDDLDFFFGKGLGRFPAGYFFATSPAEHPGGYRLVEENGESYLQISGGRHVLGWGELFRVSQRISPGKSPYQIEWDVKADADVRLHFEICEKHLLYNAVCAGNALAVKGTRSVWQHLQLPIPGDQPTRGDWYAPKIITFSLAIETRGGMAYLDNIVLSDAYGDKLLSNSDFSHGFARWFSSSDRHHMPWHMKNLFMHVLFDQGAIGLILLSVLIFMAFFRLTVKGARHHPLAPALAGGLAGFIVVGMFDSLLDVPRLSLLFYFLLMVSLVIRTASNDGRAGSLTHARR